jgi:hypothetical protein
MPGGALVATILRFYNGLMKTKFQKGLVTGKSKITKSTFKLSTGQLRVKDPAWMNDECSMFVE